MSKFDCGNEPVTGYNVVKVKKKLNIKSHI